jgi:hypothetical protein
MTGGPSLAPRKCNQETRAPQRLAQRLAIEGRTVSAPFRRLSGPMQPTIAAKLESEVLGPIRSLPSLENRHPGNKHAAFCGPTGRGVVRSSLRTLVSLIARNARGAPAHGLPLV